MPRYYVIGWRPHGKLPYFFRGDNRHEIFLPFVSNDGPTEGWVDDIVYARIFETFPCLDTKSISKHLDASRIEVYPHEEKLLPTQIFRPLKRPKKPRKPKPRP